MTVCLLPSKKIGIEDSSDGKGFNPSEMQCDFELASQNSFKKCFPNATAYVKIVPSEAEFYHEMSEHVCTR